MGSIKTAISLDENLLKHVDKLSEEMQISRSRLFTLAMNEYLKKQENQALLARLNQAYADGHSEEEGMLMQSMKDKHSRMIDQESWE